jgi:hypothetical protein
MKRWFFAIRDWFLIRKAIGSGLIEFGEVCQKDFCPVCSLGKEQK